MSTAQVAASVVSPLLLAAACVYFSPFISAVWALILERGRIGLAMPGKTVILITNLGPVPEVHVPFLDIPAAAPSPGIMFWTAVGTVVLGIISVLLRGKLTPVAFFLRAVVLVQVTALIYFFFWPLSFPYGIDDYTIAEMTAGFGVIILVPLVLGLIFYPFDFSLTKKIGLALIVTLHLGVLIPLQFTVHAYLIQKFSLLFMPVLFMLFGLLLEVTVGITLYGWGMSWAGRWEKSPLERVA